MKETPFQKFIRRSARWRNKAWTSWLRVYGPLLRISVGRGTIVHYGAMLSTQFGGSICLGDSCEILPGVRLVTYGGEIALGNHCSVNYNTIIYGHGGVTIGNDVRIAAGCVLIPANHKFDAANVPIRQQKETREGIVINDDVWIATGATILDGVEIARGCIIGAGAIVTRSTEPYGVYVGVPARLIKTRGEGVFAKLQDTFL